MMPKVFQLGDSFTIKVDAFSVKDSSTSANEIIGIMPRIVYPRELPALKILFILDKSGSMEGNKIQVVKKLLHFILVEKGDELVTSKDYISLITFDSEATVISDSQGRSVFQLTNMDERKRLFEVVNSKLQPTGWTNYEDALTRAIEQIKTLTDHVKGEVDKRRPTFIWFLTDGKPEGKGNTDPAFLATLAERLGSLGGSLWLFGIFREKEEQPISLLRRLGSHNVLGFHGLFNWDNPEWYEKRLKKYLEGRFGIQWRDEVTIEKYSNEDAIAVIDDQHTVILRRVTASDGSSRIRVSLDSNPEITEELLVHQEDQRSFVYTPESATEIFHIRDRELQRRILTFLGKAESLQVNELLIPLLNYMDQIHHEPPTFDKVQLEFQFDGLVRCVFPLDKSLVSISTGEPASHVSTIAITFPKRRTQEKSLQFSYLGLPLVVEPINGQKPVAMRLRQIDITYRLAGIQTHHVALLNKSIPLETLIGHDSESVKLAELFKRLRTGYRVQMEIERTIRFLNQSASSLNQSASRSQIEKAKKEIKRIMEGLSLLISEFMSS